MMACRPYLLICTVCLLLFAPFAIRAEDAPASGPAVSGPNGKFSFEGGTSDDGADFMFRGGYTVPLGDMFGFQIDGEAGRVGQMLKGGIGAHLFARDPSLYLLGLYASAHNWNAIDIARVAVESELYWGRITLGGVAGVEWVDVPDTRGGLVVINDDETSAFAVLDFSLYPTDNVRLTGGYRRENRQDFASFGVETQLDGLDVATTLYANCRTDLNGNDSFHAGITFHLGGDPWKSLIRRHREDDPPPYSPMFPTLVLQAAASDDSDAAAPFSCAAYDNLPDGGGGACSTGVDYLNHTCGSCTGPYEVANPLTYEYCGEPHRYDFCGPLPVLTPPPLDCDSGTKSCRDGSLVVRDPLNGCAFHSCETSGGSTGGSTCTTYDDLPDGGGGACSTGVDYLNHTCGSCTAGYDVANPLTHRYCGGDPHRYDYCGP